MVGKREERLVAAYDYLKSKGMAHKQQDIAEAMNTNKSNISHALNGDQRFLTDSFLRRFNAAYGNIFNDKWLVEGRVEYRRAKTGRLYSIKAEPEALELIQRYKGNEHLLNVADHCKDYRHFANRLNINLHTLLPQITTYWVRHSWATIAAELDIPKDTIAAALGHGGHSVTDIYIDFDRNKVDAANRRVIDYVLYGK